MHLYKNIYKSRLLDLLIFKNNLNEIPNGEIRPQNFDELKLAFISLIK